MLLPGHSTKLNHISPDSQYDPLNSAGHSTQPNRGTGAIGMNKVEKTFVLPI